MSPDQQVSIADYLRLRAELMKKHQVDTFMTYMEP